MNFRQKEDGSCDINFEDHEIEIIKKHKKIHLSALSLRHFGNCFMRMVVQFHEKFPDEVKQEATYDHSKIVGEKPKDV